MTEQEVEVEERESCCSLLSTSQLQLPTSAPFILPSAFTLLLVLLATRAASGMSGASSLLYLSTVSSAHSSCSPSFQLQQTLASRWRRWKDTKRSRFPPRSAGCLLLLPVPSLHLPHHNALLHLTISNGASRFRLSFFFQLF
jgi:hypothetical protein